MQLKLLFSPEARFDGIFSEPCTNMEITFSDSKDPAVDYYEEPAIF